MEPAFQCKDDCLLRDLLEFKTRYLTTNEEKISILVDQVEESNTLENINELIADQEKQESKTQEMNKVLKCLMDGCTLCYPETGTHYDSEVEVSEEDEEEDDEEESASQGSEYASETNSEYSSDEN